MNPLKVGVFAWQLASHKLIRWLAPLFICGCFVASLALALQESTFFQAVLLVQIAFYLLAAARWVPGVGEFKIVYLCYFFCLSNLASGVGIMNIVLGRRFSTWTPQRNVVTK